MNPFLIALQLLTRIPVTLPVSATEDDHRISLYFYPVVGLLIGIILLVIASLSSLLTSDLVAAMILLFWIVITGALHLDGLADSADAWIGGHGNKEKSLKIMKDPASGPVAVVILVTAILFKFITIHSILDHEFFAMILFAPVVSRLSAGYLVISTPYARDNGMASIVSRNHNLMPLHIMTFCFLGIMLYIGGPAFLIGAATMYIPYYFLRKMMFKRIGGFTGDTTGALIETIEIYYLFVISILVNI